MPPPLKIAAIIDDDSCRRYADAAISPYAAVRRLFSPQPMPIFSILLLAH
jgi:hypothetical protein